MAQCGVFQPLSSVSFERKLQFSASQDLSFARSKCFKIPETASQSSVWSIKPPDFSVKLYSRMSQKKDKKTHSHRAVPQHNEAQTRTRKFLQNVHLNPKRKDPPEFIVSHRPPDALQSELMFVKMGKYHSGPYKNPTPHNFRPLDENLPDIVTAYEKDPGNLNFKLKHLDTLRTIRSEIELITRDAAQQMDTYKPAEPKWDGKLILPPLSWPPKSASYTRHRRRRGAYSAFLDRVEEKLHRMWTNQA